MRINLLASTAVLTTTFAAGCSPGSPLSPAPPTQTVSPIQALVSVVIEDAFAIVHPEQGGRFSYEVRFLLRETSGRGGATVFRVAVFGPTDESRTGVECWREQVQMRIPPGGVLDIFHTDAGAKALSYCGPVSEGTTANPSLAVSVFFNGEDGSAGRVDARITSLRQP